MGRLGVFLSFFLFFFFFFFASHHNDCDSNSVSVLLANDVLQRAFGSLSLPRVDTSGYGTVS
jgi:hypothetical protein